MKHNEDASFMLGLMKNFISSTIPEKKLTESAINYCVHFGIGAILAETYLQHAELTSSEIKEKLLSVSLTAKYCSAARQSAIAELVTYANTHGIKIILLKGIDLSRSLYKSPHLRQMGDVDILVAQECAQTIANFLLSVGYLQKSDMPDSFYETHQHLKPFHHPQTDVWVEVHTRLFPLLTPHGQRALFQPDYLLNNLTSTKHDPGTAYALKPEINLHYTITHWIREFKIANSMTQLIDIALLVNKPDLNWKEFTEYIRTREQASEIKLVFGILHKNNLASIPDEVLRKLNTKKDSMGLIGLWLLNSIIHGYLHQDKFVTQIVGATNASRIWDAYLRDKNSFLNHIQAIRSILFPTIEGQSAFVSTTKRIKRLLQRSYATLKGK